MVQNKDFKRLVRTRMAKTGESYTAARAHLLRHEPEARPPLPPKYEALAGMSDDTVRARTGRDWPGWVRALDEAGAAGLPHRDIAHHLADEHALTPWWSQMVTVGYERLRGLRDVGQRRGGAYEISKSKTVPVPVGTLYRAFADPESRSRWLDDPGLTIRNAHENRTLRMRLADETPVEATFVAKGEVRSTVTIQHRSLPDKESADRMRVVWSERLTALATLLTRP